MPLFSTLCGNDIIEFDDVKQFHDRLPGKQHKFRKVAQFMNKLKSIHKFNDDDFFNLAKTINPCKNPNEFVLLIKKSLKLYNLELIEESRRSGYENATKSGSVYEILHDLPTSLSFGYFDIR